MRFQLQLFPDDYDLPIVMCGADIKDLQDFTNHIVEAFYVGVNQLKECNLYEEAQRYGI